MIEAAPAANSIIAIASHTRLCDADGGVPPVIGRDGPGVRVVAGVAVAPRAVGASVGDGV